MFKAYKEKISWEAELRQLMKDWNQTLDFFEDKVLKERPDAASRECLEKLRNLDRQMGRVMDGVVEENGKLRKLNVDLTLENEQLRSELKQMRERTRSLEARMQESEERAAKQEQQRRLEMDSVQRQLKEIHSQLGHKTQRVQRSFRALSQAIIAAHRLSNPSTGQQPVQL